MFSRVISAAVYGIDAYIVNVETDVGFGLPTFDMSGALGSKVREAKDRVRVAIKNSGIELTPQKIVINISPANIRKEGTIYDLPIAIGILAANGCFDLKILENVLIIGEVSLDGSINPVKGVLPMVCAAKEAGIDNCIIPKANIAEGRIMNNINIDGVETLSQTIEILKNIAVIDGSRKNIKQADVKSGECNKSDGNINNDTYNVLERSRVKFTYGSEVKNNNHSCSYNIDYSDISGQEAAKRATMIAVSGMHNIMYIGPPGSGKTMLAQRIPTIMPDMDYEEQLRLTKIYSVAGLLDSEGGIMVKRPFRNPHHTITQAALLGGGAVPRPGEITLSEGGVLFLDEMTEFNQVIMEALRQPLEDKVITLVRVNAAYTYPAHFMLAAAINPCKCGYYPDRNRCHCSEYDIRRYIGRISNPMWDRFDMCVKVDEVSYEVMRNKGNVDTIYNSTDMKNKVEAARQMQKDRFKKLDINYNSQMGVREIHKYCTLNVECNELMERMYKQHNMSARAYNKVLKTARTIADLKGSVNIEKEHLTEALFYKNCEVKS